MLLQTIYEIKINGLEYLLQPLKTPNPKRWNRPPLLS
jgi:hypothetical protein